MKLIIKGKFLGEEYLPTADLPQNAVAFNEPKTANELLGSVKKYLWVAVGATLVAVLLNTLIHKTFYLSVLFFVLGFLASFTTIFFHELLHAVCFGKKASVYLYWDIKKLMMFVVSPQAVSKKRFIVMSLLPNVVFGFLPLAVYAFIPPHIWLASFLVGFAFNAICMGAGDYLNVHNAIKQMPKNSYQQLNGFNSYWFVEDNK